MQRSSGQYDHLARVPRAGPRQSRGRRSFASRHWCRTAPRRSRGMEPTVRSTRTQSAIGSELRISADDSPVPADQFRPELQVARNGIFGCRDWRPRISSSDRYYRQRPGTLKIGGEIPAETAPFRSTTVSAVREDWMVETIWTKLHAPHAVIENQSPNLEPGTEFFAAETGEQNPPFRLLETGIETRRDSKSPRSGGISATKLNGVRSL